MSKNASKKPPLDLGFSINEYDWEGDVEKDGIFLHINSYIKLPVGELADLDNWINQLQAIKAEIKENYPGQS